MPGSDFGQFPGHDPLAAAHPAERWGRALCIGLAVLLLGLAVVAGRVAWFDPYWVFRETPPWFAKTQGGNRLLDRQTRRAKVLQALTRSYTTAFVGSSTTYHGLDPADADLAAAGGVFNVGISGILADELPAVASVVASRPNVRRIAFGVDYYMFSRTDASVRLDASLKGWIGRADALLGSLFGRYAIHDAWPHEVEGRTDPGRWTREGFRVTPRLPPEDTRLNDQTRRRTTVGLSAPTLASLDEALAILAGREVDLYLAPVSGAQRKVLADLGHLADFERWRAEIRRIAERHGVRFHDFVDLGRDLPFDPDYGSSEGWLDNLHYTPVVGRRVLSALGLRRPEPAPASR